MSALRRLVIKGAEFLRAEQGATAIEYGLMTALVVVAMLIGLSALGTGVFNLWDDNATKIAAAFASVT